MIKLSKKDYNLIKPIVENLDYKLETESGGEIVDDLLVYLAINNRDTEIYSDHDYAVEDVMDYINYNYG